MRLQPGVLSLSQQRKSFSGDKKMKFFNSQHLDSAGKNKSIRRSLSAGFTFMEMMIATTIGLMAMSALGTLSLYTARSFLAMSNYSELSQQSRNALDLMTGEIRQANRLLSGDGSSISLEDWDGKKLAYYYNDDLNQLIREKEDEDPKVLLENCEEFKATLFQRNPVEGEYEQYPSATSWTCKLIQLDWRCAKSVMGDRVNSEVVQSAKIVIRKQ
jgi:hypothetical protein